MKILKAIADWFRPTQSHAHSALSAIANRPMMTTKANIDVMLAGFGSNKPQASADGWEPYGSKPEHLISIVGSVGVLSISGPLFHRYDMSVWWWGGQGYDMIGAAFQMLVSDPAVSEIVMQLDSGGGQCSGCFDLVDAIKAKRGIKPITAVVSDCAASACYAIASAADKIIVSRTSTTGSIGVIATHIDVSAWLKNAGVKYTYITSGEKKADFNQAEPLSDSAREDMQAEVDRLADIFVQTVAENRGLDPDAIRAMQAGCFYGASAIAAGLADEVGTMDSFLSGKAEVEQMPVDPEPTPESKTPAPTLSAEQLQQVDYAAAVSTIMQAQINQHARLALLKVADITQATAADRITHAQACADLCAAAGDVTLSADYIARNTPLDVVRTQLLGAKSADGSEIDTTPPPKTSQASKLDSAAIYQQRRSAAEGVSK